MKQEIKPFIADVVFFIPTKQAAREIITFCKKSLAVPLYSKTKLIEEEK